MERSSTSWRTRHPTHLLFRGKGVPLTLGRYIFLFLDGILLLCFTDEVKQICFLGIK